MYCTLCKVVSGALWVHVPASPTHPAHHCGGCAAAVVDGLGGSLLADTNSYLSSSIAIVGRILCGMWHLYTVCRSMRLHTTGAAGGGRHSAEKHMWAARSGRWELRTLLIDSRKVA